MAWVRIDGGSGMLDGPPDKPVFDLYAADRMRSDVAKILRDMGLNPTLVEMVHFCELIRQGATHDLRPHEVVGFMAYHWPVRVLGSAGATRLAEAAWSAVDRDEARLPVISAAFEGRDMGFIASRLVFLNAVREQRERDG